MIAGTAVSVPTEGLALLRRTADEEHRVRAGADGARIEIWRRTATVDIPHAALTSLVSTGEAERAQLPLPLDRSLADDDTLPFLVVSRAGT